MRGCRRRGFCSCSTLPPDLQGTACTTSCNNTTIMGGRINSHVSSCFPIGNPCCPGVGCFFSKLSRTFHRVCPASLCETTNLKHARMCPSLDSRFECYMLQFGGCQEASSTMKHNSDNVRLFMDQEPSFQVAKFVYECMEFRRSEECEDYNVIRG